MKLASGARRRDDAGADEEISEVLAIGAFLRVAGEQGIEQRDDLRLPKILRVELVEPCAVESGAEVEIISVRTAADEANFGEIRPGAAVRAAGHADDDVVVAQTRALQAFLKPADETRQISLAFGQRQTASGKSDAGHRIPSKA